MAVLAPPAAPFTKSLEPRLAGKHPTGAKYTLEPVEMGVGTDGDDKDRAAGWRT